MASTTNPVDDINIDDASSFDLVEGNAYTNAKYDMSNADNDSYIPMKPQLKKKKNKKRDTSTLRKAPQAPKRFKSSYICFFTAKQAEFKKELGDTSTIAEISKLSGQKWKALPADVRNYWDDVAAQDKLRYDIEKASYTGPWQVPSKRAKKDPSAPKRSMSAFLFFSQGRRSQIKAKNPEMKNTEISKMLGNLWRNCPDDDRRPYVEKEKIERDKYKIAMAKWKVEFDKLKEEEKEREQQQYYQQLPPLLPTPQQRQQQQQYVQQPPTDGMEGGIADGHIINNAPHQQQMQHHYPQAAPYMQLPSTSGLTQQYLPYAASQQTAYSVGIGGSGRKNQLVILGPNGMPHHYQMPPAAAAAIAIAPSPSASPQEQHIDNNTHVPNWGNNTLEGQPIPILQNVGIVDNNNSIA